MQPDPATSAFLAYCRSGDGRHLGRAFDLVAPELLLVAARLLPRHADAPDLVQRTFLTALQRRRAFDPTRRLAPWLFGMLLQHVRHERRRLQRQVDARRLREADVESPLDTAIGAEAVEQVRAAVAALPPPYRQVVHLHLVHDLRCHEVAASLGLPFRTVQSQLRRGLARLRRQLPVPAVAAWCDPLRGLAGVRAAVLRKAAMLAPFGWLSLSWLKLGLAAAAVCAATIGLVGASGTRAEVALAASVAGDAAARADVSSPALPVATPVVEHVRIPVQDPEPTCVVRLQVLGTGGATLADAALRAELWADARGTGSASWQQAKRADREGWLQCEPPRRAAHRLRLWITAPGHLAVEARVDAPDRETFTFAPLVLPQAVRGRIQVRDSAGAGVPRLAVGVQLTLPNGFTAPCQMLPTGADGWTRSDDADGAVELPVGKHRVNLVAVPVSFCTNGEHQVELELRAGDQVIELQLRDQKRVISGSVVDNDERPLANAWVALEGGDVATASLPRVLTDGKGRFALATDGAGPFRLTASTHDSGSRGTVAAVSPGDHEVVVRVPLQDGFRLRVVDERDQPVEDYRVTCFEVGAHQQAAGPPGSRLAGPHRDGRVFVDRVGVGNLRLLVLPAPELGLLPSGYLPIRIEQLGQEVVVRLRAPQPVAVRLVDGDGNAVPGSTVRLVALLEKRDGSELPAPALSNGRFHRSRWSGAIELASAVTDARGVATLLWQPWSEPVLVRAEGPGHVVREHELPGIAPGTAPIELRVAKSARLQVTVRSIERWSAFAVTGLGEPATATYDRLCLVLVLRDAGDGRLEAGPRGEGFAIRPDGTCQCDDVPPGRWQVLLRWYRPARVGSVLELVQRPLAEVVAIAGKEATATVDLAAVVPGAIRGRILLDGVPAQAKMLEVGDVGRDHRGQPKVGNRMRWEGFALPESRYRIAGALGGELQVDALIDGHWYQMLASVRVEPGQEREVDLEFRHLVARIRVLSSDGAPLANRLLRFAGNNDMRTTDADGSIAIDPVPAMRAEVNLYQAGLDSVTWRTLRGDDPRKQPVWTTTVEFDARPAQSFELTVPVER